MLTGLMLLIGMSQGGLCNTTSVTTAGEQKCSFCDSWNTLERRPRRIKPLTEFVFFSNMKMERIKREWLCETESAVPERKRVLKKSTCDERPPLTNPPARKQKDIIRSSDCLYWHALQLQQLRWHRDALLMQSNRAGKRWDEMGWGWCQPHWQWKHNCLSHTMRWGGRWVGLGECELSATSMQSSGDEGQPHCDWSGFLLSGQPSVYHLSMAPIS